LSRVFEVETTPHLWGIWVHGAYERETVGMDAGVGSKGEDEAQLRKSLSGR